VFIEALYKSTYLLPLLRVVCDDAGRIAYHCVSPPKRRAAAAVCRKWHNLGSWSRATTGDYRFSSVIEVPPSACLTTLPDYEHPRLVVVLPPVQRLSHADWSDNSRLYTLINKCTNNIINQSTNLFIARGAVAVGRPIPAVNKNAAAKCLS